MATTVSKSPSEPSIREKVQNVIDLIRPAVQADGGDIELVDVTGEGVIHNHELHRLYKKVDQLSDEDQQALVIVLDSLVKRSRVRRVMTE